MRSPEFRKHTGFIKQKATNDSHNSSEEEQSSYRFYERPMNNPQQYVYPSLSRDYNRASPNINQQRRLSPERDESSSDFDQFEMNSNLASEFRKGENKQKPAQTDSSFSLSPYQNSSYSDEEAQPYKAANYQLYPSSFNRGPIRQQISEQQSSLEMNSKVKYIATENHRLLRPHKNELSKNKRSRSNSSGSLQPADDHQKDKKTYDLKYRVGEAIHHNRFQPKQTSGKKQDIYKREASSPSSSSFSLDSSSPKRQISEDKRKVLLAGRDIGRKQQKIPNSFSNSKKPINDKTATFNKPDEPRPKIAQVERRFQNLDQSKGSSSQQELVSQYNTKEFKGGSMKQRILNNYYNIQKQVQRDKRQFVNRQQLTTTNQLNRPLSKPLESPVYKLQPRQPKLLTQQMKDSESGEDSSVNPQKAEAFEVDVKVKNMSLAEAFAIRCGRLKQKLQQEREEFKRGNHAKLYKQIQQENNRNQSNTEIRHVEKHVEKRIQKPINKNLERMAMGIKTSVTKKEMYQLTKKNYKQLPEVQQRLNEEKKRQDRAKRMQNVKKLDREVRLKLKYAGKH